MSREKSAWVLAALRNATMACCQIPVYFDLGVLLKLSTVNTSIMIFYADVGIPVEGGKILEEDKVYTEN